MKGTALKLLVVLASVFAPAGPMLGTALALILIDLVTGVIAAKKQGLPITSAGIGRSVVKLLVYESAIALAFLVQKYMTGDAVPAASIVSGLVGMTELLSCLENINIISGGDLLKSIIAKLGSKNQ